MWITGLIALLQVVYLPGNVLLRFFRVRELNLIERLAYSFALSLMANCVLVTVLVTIGLHTAGVLWTVILLEVIAALSIRDPHAAAWKLGLARLGLVRRLNLRTLLGGLFLLSTLVVYEELTRVNWGSVFTGNDEVASWDRWAMEWARGEYPWMTSFYPQLMPANWSITYVLLGNADVKLFARATTTLYPLFSVMLFLSMALKRHDAAPLFGGALLGWIFAHYLGFAFLTYGYADVPLAFFGLLTFYAAYREEDRDRTGILLCLLFGLGAVLTKQGGIYITAAAAVYALWWRWRKSARQALFARDPQTAIVLAIAVFSSVWFGVKLLQVRFGSDYSHITFLTQALHQGRSCSERLAATGRMFLTNRGFSGPWVTWTLATMLVFGLLIRPARMLLLLVAAPFLLLYSLFFSYEIRNAAPAFPILALVCGFAVDRILRPLDRVPPRVARSLAVVAVVIAIAFGARVLAAHRGISSFWAASQPLSVDPWLAEAQLWWGSGLLVAGIAMLLLLFVPVPNRRLNARWIFAAALLLFASRAVIWPDHVLLASQFEKQRAIGSPAINQLLYAAVEQQDVHSAIVTDYWFLRALPEIKHLFRATTCAAPCDLHGLRNAVISFPDAGWVLMHEGALAADLREALAGNQEFTTIFTVAGVRFMRVNREALATARRLPEVVEVFLPADSGNPHVLRVSLRDADGPADVRSATVVVKARLDDERGCYVRWERQRGFTILNSAEVSTPSDLRRPRPADPGSRSLCDLDEAKTSVAETHQHVVLSLALVFSRRFSEPPQIFVDAQQQSRESAGFRAVSRWDVAP